MCKSDGGGGPHDRPTTTKVGDHTGEQWLSCTKCAAQAQRLRASVTFSALRAMEAA